MFNIPKGYRMVCLCFINGRFGVYITDWSSNFGNSTKLIADSDATTIIQRKCNVCYRHKDGHCSIYIDKKSVSIGNLVSQKIFLPTSVLRF